MVHYNFAYPNHVVIDLYGVPANIVDNLEVVSGFAKEAAAALNSNIVKQVYKRTDPGLIYIAVLLQSHISYHSWPEFGYAALDIYACSNVPVTKILSLVPEYFKAKYMKITLLNRKVPTSLEEHL